MVVYSMRLEAASHEERLAVHALGDWKNKKLDYLLLIIGNDYKPAMNKKFTYHLKEILLIFLLMMSPALFAQKHENLVDAIRNNDTRLLQKLLKSKASINQPDEEGDTPLMLAALYGNTSTLQWLLQKGADPNKTNKDGETPFMWAIHDLEKLKILLQYGADLNALAHTGNSALLIGCVGANQYELVSFLLQNGADPGVKNLRKETPLMRAALFGDTATISLLIEKGNDVNAIDSIGLTPLLNALFNVNRNATIYLLKKGADPDMKAAFGLTAISSVVTYNDLPSVLAVLELTKQINAVDDGGISALMWAAYNEHDNPAIIKALLDKGADHSIIDKKGQTALDWARKKGNTKTVALLIAAGAH
ncbi:MAG: ankyrin repeat domain-containing protein [Flavisolibacter sp.]